MLWGMEQGECCRAEISVLEKANEFTGILVFPLK
jgi:hypothetical protein